MGTTSTPTPICAEGVGLRVSRFTWSVSWLESLVVHVLVHLDAECRPSAGIHVNWVSLQKHSGIHPAALGEEPAAAD